MIGFYILLSVSIVLNMVLFFLFSFKTLNALESKIDYVLNRFILVARQSGLDEGNKQGIKEQKAIQKEIDSDKLKDK